MTASRSTKSTEEGMAPDREFYGLADHPNHGIIASILKRKSRKFKMTEDVKKMCKQVDAYKLCSDNLHQSLMYMLVEDPEISKNLVNVIKTEPNYRYAAQYLRTYEGVAKKGRDKTEYQSLEPVVKTLMSLDAEHERRVRKQLDNLKPLTKWIGEDYWEYARMRRVYWEALEAFDDAVTIQNKERTEQAEQATAVAQAWRNECRLKLIDFIKTGINDQKSKHADCVLKYRDEMILYHRAMAELIPFNEPAPGEKRSPSRTPNK
ncbi:unnamed protein product [Caenorhabditis brenneri]